MMSSTSQDLEWIRSLQLFLDCRLRSSRQCGDAQFPLMPMNTQYLVDGIVLAINDHPELAASSWSAVLGHLRDCHGRYERLKAQLNEANVARRHGLGRIRYACVATVQDLYLAWCMIDGLVKNTTIDAIRQSVDLEMPRLVASNLSLLWSASADAPPMLLAAVAEFRGLFLDLVRSWPLLRSIRPDTIRRCEEHVKQALRVASQLAESTASARSDKHGANVVAKFIARQQQQARETSGSGGSSSKSAKLLDSVVMQLNDCVRNPFACKHCGAYFTSADACSKHYRVHFFARAQMTRGDADPMVRLRPCTKDEFVGHAVMPSTDGSFVRTVAPSSDAYRGDSVVVVRKVVAPTSVGLSQSGGPNLRKRQRTGVYVLEDPSVVVPCVVCRQAIQCRLDATTGEWILLDTAEVPAGVCHAGCARSDR